MGLKYVHLENMFWVKKVFFKILSWTEKSGTYANFQNTKFFSSFEFVCRPMFSTFWHLRVVVKFGYDKRFLSHIKSRIGQKYPKNIWRHM